MPDREVTTIDNHQTRPGLADHDSTPTRLVHGLTAVDAIDGIEKQLPDQITVSANYVWARGVHLLRTRNINAPIPCAAMAPGASAKTLASMPQSGTRRLNK